jgi:hypothetical protein
MEKVSIRNLRGRTLRDHARKGEWLAITNHRVLIGIIIPAPEGWVQHLVPHDWPHLRQCIDEAENAMAAGSRLITIQDAVPAPDAERSRETGNPGKPGMQPAAAAAGTGVAHTPENKVAIEQLSKAGSFLPGQAAPQGDDTTGSPVRTVRIGDLSATLIDIAGVKGQVLAVTHDRELIGILVPVTQDLVQSLIEENISRVLDSIDKGEGQLGSAGRMITLDEEIPPRRQSRSRATSAGTAEQNAIT